MGIRSAIEGTYHGQMSVYRRFPKIENGRTVFREEAIYSDIPCAFSRSTGTRKEGEALRSGKVAYADYVAKVFLAPEYTIPPGCRIVIAQDGMLRDFISSGEAMVYPTHQEIVLTREEMV